MTELQLERTQEPPGPEDGHIGYTVEEMAEIVERLLRDIGLTKNLSRLVVVVRSRIVEFEQPARSGARLRRMRRRTRRAECARLCPNGQRPASARVVSAQRAGDPGRHRIRRRRTTTRATTASRTTTWIA